MLTSNQPPHGAQGRRLLGPAALRSCPSASLHGQVWARLGTGGYCRRSGNGGPQTCLPVACGVAQRGAQHGPSSPTLKTLARGQASRGGRQGASSGTASSGWLTRRRRVQGGVPHEVPMTQAMTTKGARRALGGRQPAKCPPFPFGAKGASTGQGIRQRLPFRCNKTKTSRTAGWKSLWSPGRRHHQSLWEAKTAFVRITCTSCPLSTWPLLAPFLLNI